ncbi:MAG: DMT family transporter [Magnetococcus sp. WYHC-3]
MNLITAWRARFAALDGNHRGIAWMVVSALCFATVAAQVKLLGQQMPPQQVAFFRCLFGLLVLLPLFWSTQGRVLHTRCWTTHLSRSLLGLLAMNVTFWAVVHLPLADVTALSFSSPLFTILLAVLLLREHVSLSRWMATLTGFAGVLVMVRPGGEGFDPALLMALASPLLVALVRVLIKQMTRTEGTLTVVAWFSILGTLISALPAWITWVTPTPAAWAQGLLMGAVATIAQLAMTEAYREAEASAVTPFDYLRLVITTLYGMLLFGDIPDRWTFLGSLMVFASHLYMLRTAHQERDGGTLSPG